LWKQPKFQKYQLALLHGPWRLVSFITLNSQPSRVEGRMDRETERELSLLMKTHMPELDRYIDYGSDKVMIYDWLNRFGHEGRDVDKWYDQINN
jgi:hypothetical protein